MFSGIPARITADIGATGGLALDATLSTRASEGTLVTRASELTLSLVKTDTAKLDVPLSTRSTEGTLLGVKGDTANLDIALSTRATEGTLLAVKGDTANLDVTLSSRASELTAALIKAKTDNLDTPLSTRATEATLLLVKADTAKLDADLSSRASEATLASVLGVTTSIDAVLATRASEGTLITRASESTLATRASELTLALVKAKTDNLDVALSTRATEVTLASRSSEVTLAGVKIGTDRLDVPLSTRASEGSLLSLKTGTDRLDVPLSTRASEATVLSLKASTDNLDTPLSNRASEATLAKLTIPQGSPLGTHTQVMVGGSVSAAHPTYVAGNVSPLSMTTDGRARVSTRSSGSSATGTLSASGDTVDIPVYGQSSVTFSLNGTWLGTIVVEGTINGTNWFTAHSAPSGSLVGSSSIVSTGASINAPYTVIPLPLNCTAYRLRMSDYTSGSVAVDMRESDTSKFVMLMGASHGGTMRQVASVDRVLNYNVLSVMAMDFSAHESFEKRVYSMSAEFTLPSINTESPAFILSNPAGSGKLMVLYRANLDIFTAGGFSRCKFYANPAGTPAGVAAEIVSRNVGGGAAASVMTCLAGAITGLTGNGTKIDSASVDSSNGREINYHYNTIIQPGNSLLITGTPDANNRLLAATITWSEITA